MRIANMLIVVCVLLAWVALATGGLVGWYLRGRHEREKRRQLPPATARQLKRAARANRAELHALVKRHPHEYVPVPLDVPLDEFDHTDTKDIP